MATLAEIKQARDNAERAGRTSDVATLQQMLDAASAFRGAVKSGNQEDAAALASFLSERQINDAFEGIQQTGPGSFLWQVPPPLRKGVNALALCAQRRRAWRQGLLASSHLRKLRLGPLSASNLSVSL